VHCERPCRFARDTPVAEVVCALREVGCAIVERVVDETMAAVMPRGSVMLYVGSLYRGGGDNHSTANRLGLNVG